MPVTWQSHGGHMPVTCLWHLCHAGHMQSHACHKMVTCRSIQNAHWQTDSKSHDVPSMLPACELHVTMYHAKSGCSKMPLL